MAQTVDPKELKILHIHLSEIEIGERLRKDLGDTEDLEKSIRKLGLLQPIGVTENKKLVWGWRRLETWKRVKGDEPIPAIVFSDESSRLAELAENLCRLDLSWYLKSVAVAEFHKQLEAWRLVLKVSLQEPFFLQGFG